ncbi:MAG: ROK family protein [Planctomycetaceae bacterium]|nr:ROK family protein [Planctomycetaceae bacterium]
MTDPTEEKPVRRKEPVWVGFDLGGTKMMAVVFNDKYEILGKKRRRTREKGKDGVSLGRLTETIHLALEDAGVDPAGVQGIGAGCPGPLDLKKGVILEAPNLGWKNVPLREQLAAEFKCSAEICNDVDAGVYGEYQRGVAQGARCVLGVFPGTGIGGGCVYEGRIFHGSRASCMEVGFLQMATEGPAAGIGPVGTLEGLASRLAISAEAAKAVFRGRAPKMAALAGTDLANIRSGTLSKAIEAGDKVIEDIVRRAAEQVGRGIGSLVNILAPDIVVLGGGLVEAMPKLYAEEVQNGIKRNALPSLQKVFELKIAELGDFATAIGAAAWARTMAGTSDTGKK